MEAVTELSPAPESWTEHPGGAGEGRKQVASALRKHRGHRRSLTTLQTEFCGPWGGGCVEQGVLSPLLKEAIWESGQGQRLRP